MNKWNPLLLTRPHVLITSIFTRPASPFRRHRYFTTTVVDRDPLHAGNHFASIPNRGILELEGPDTVKFLQGLITNHMPKLENGGDGFYAGFLTPQVGWLDWADFFFLFFFWVISGSSTFSRNNNLCVETSRAAFSMTSSFTL